MVAASPSVGLSIVSHGQGGLVTTLLHSLEENCQGFPVSIVLTLNIDENADWVNPDPLFPLTVIKNHRPRGFGANHNTAFKTLGNIDYFCVMNPDILLPANPFPALLSILGKPTIGVVGPALIDSQGHLQDSCRKFPTPWSILLRMVGKKDEYQQRHNLFYPDWIAGMFMLFPSRIFAELGGFDERYFMYCEDADICRRIQKKGLKTAYTTDILAIHDPRRSSHRNLRHLWWHLNSLLRFFVMYYRHENTTSKIQ